MTSRAISQILSIIVAVAIILAALGGYAFGYLSHPAASPSNHSPITMTEYQVRVVNGNQTIIISGTCTQKGNPFLMFTTIEYMGAANVTGYFNATITTVSSNTIFQSEVTEIISTTNGSGNNSSSCPVFG